MERDASNKLPAKDDSPAARANGRFTSPLVINSASRRRSLFSRPRSSGDDATEGPADAPQPQTVGDGSFDSKSGSAGQTKIPRPSQRSSQSRRPFTLSDAYRMAEEEEAAQGSPSPAPRAWRSRRDPSDGKLQKAPYPGSAEPQRRVRQNAKPAELRREGTASSVDSIGSQSQRSDVSGSDFENKLRQHALDQGNADYSPQRGSGLFSKSRLGFRISETAKDLARKTSRNSLEGDSPSRSGKSSPSNSWLGRRLSAKRTESDSPVKGPTSSDQDLRSPHVSGPDSFTRPATVPPDYRSPEKSFAWQADEDFTAGDLQVSNSPRVVIGRSNTKIDEIRALEAEFGQPSSNPPLPQTRNTKLDEIRALEIEMEAKLADESPEFTEHGNSRESRSEKGDKLQRNWQASAPSTKVDELRSREIESLSRRALATARLDEIRERQASEQSRSPSPEAVRKASKDPIRSLSPTAAQVDQGPNSAADLARLPVDEAVVLDASSNEKDSKNGDHEANNSEGGERQALHGQTSRLRGDSRDVLRRLALATSTSPSSEQQTFRDRDIIDDGSDPAKQKKADSAKTDVRLTVGFVGLQRDSSAESLSDKRSNFAHSDSDPIERIEAERNLFALMENHSERGSLRAPSPTSEPETVEETPRPAKPDPDPLTQPTPRVVGAFVDTPLVVKFEGSGDTGTSAATKSNQTAPVPTSNDGPPVATELAVARRSDGADAAEGIRASISRGRKAAISSRNPRVTLSTRGDRTQGRSSSVGRRAKSLSRARKPLINSARPPTVKDDLLEIQRTSQVDDSTLDDFAELLRAPKAGGAEVKGPGTRLRQGLDGLSNTQEELEAYDRMSKSLTTGLLGIRTAKQGIERLEDKVSHVETKSVQTDTKHTAEVTPEHDQEKCTICQGGSQDDAATYVRFPFPRLWHSQPKFKFTLFGLVLFVLSLWYIAESAMCHFYCKPMVCYPGRPCDWSPDDPLWGYSIPSKLDEWLTGGHGKALARQLRPELADWVADIWDAATGTDITTINTSRYSWDQKRQHRRRLMKRGLVKAMADRPEDREKVKAWKAARLVKERTESARAMGYMARGDEESMANDETI
ncbi:hypothetical protein QBC47DRAFT_376385 [Echria macrotheca]|uniref:Uncharacterized protein n=1 Tax=Echria macrotheca TaxID=438768 RepID=A0AAJ0BIN5_9PEZI|nr:hypothetical protein QBC47DRAFT_376385 [Echria macrotheca]